MAVSKINRMFAVLNIYKNTDVGSQLASIMLAFFMPVLLGILYRYSCTPVRNCNGTAASVLNVLSSGKGTDTFLFQLFVLCLTKVNTFPTLQCLAAVERPPSTRASVIHSQAIPCGSTHLQPANAAARHRPPHNFAVRFAPFFRSGIPTSVASKSQTPACSFPPVYGCVPDALCTGRPIPCRISLGCWMIPSRLVSRRQPQASLLLNFAHLMNGVGRTVTSLI